MCAEHLAWSSYFANLRTILLLRARILSHVICPRLLKESTVALRFEPKAPRHPGYSLTLTHSTIKQGSVGGVGGVPLAPTFSLNKN